MSQKRTARQAFPDNYKAAVARKRARSGLNQTQAIAVQREVKRELNKRT